MLSPDERKEAEKLNAARTLLQQGEQEGIDTLTRMAGDGSNLAALLLGEAYETSPFADPSLAEKWYRSAREPDGYTYASYRLGRLLHDLGRNDEAMALFREGVGDGDGHCMYWLARLRMDETWDKRCRHEVKDLLGKASAQGLVWPERMLARLYLRGKYGSVRIPLGFFHLIRASIRGFVIAMKDPDDPRLEF